MVWQAGGFIGRSYATELTLAQLLFDPFFSLRVLAGLCAFLAGLAALTEFNGWSWLSGISAFVMGLAISILLLNKGVDLDIYRSELMMLIVMACLSLAMVVARSDSHAKELEAHEEESTAEPLPAA